MRSLVLALGGILGHLSLRYLTGSSASAANLPLLAALLIGGVPLVLRLVWKGVQGEFGSDHLAGVSIVASALLDEYLAGAIVVLMLSSGETLEAFAVSEATSVLRALAKRVPTLAHRRKGSGFEDVPVGDLVVGDEVSILPHEICPVGGMLLSGVGMVFAALGLLSPVAGAVAQEAIDLLAVLKALRTARQPSALTDFDR